jgi:hypothetical protein
VAGDVRQLPEASVLRLLAAVSVATFLTMVAPGAALADGNGGGPVQVGGDYHSGVVTTTVTATEAPSSSGVHQVADTSPVCQWQPDQTDDAMLQSGETGSGAASQAAQGGSFYNVLCSDGTVYPGIYVPPAASNVPPAVALAQTLALRAVNQLQLPAPSVAMNPANHALVNLPEWFWVAPSSWVTLRQRTQAGPVWAVVTARPTSTTWDPGDGSAPVTCMGPGTAYVKSESAESQHSDCTYTYRRSSADQPQTGPDPNDRFFTVTVTTTWSVTWAGAGGTGGTLPAMTRSTSFPLAVAEREAVVTGGSG